MRHGSLFSGIAGFDLAAEWMGWENVFQVEWDKWCQKVLAKNFPSTLRFGDIVEFNKMLQNEKAITDSNSRGWGEYKNGEIYRGRLSDSLGDGNNEEIRRILTRRIDILTGGFPCQPFSHAGKRKGVDDSRYLWPEMLTTIRILKPAFVVGENVAGLVSMENGKTLDRILSDLANEGYTTEQFIIPACSVGAWHRRDRIWIVARRNFSDSSCTNSNFTRSYQKEINQQRETKFQHEQECKSGQVGRELPQSIIFDSLNGTDRTHRGHGGKTEGIQGERGSSGLSGESGRTGGEVYDTHTCDSRLQGVSQTGNNGRNGKKPIDQFSEGCNRGGEMWHTKSRLGGMVNGLPSFVDGYWDREPEGIPRVATGVKNRVDRLKGLGNAIVPQVAFEIFKAIDLFIND